MLRCFDLLILVTYIFCLIEIGEKALWFKFSSNLSAYMVLVYCKYFFLALVTPESYGTISEWLESKLSHYRPYLRTYFFIFCYWCGSYTFMLQFQLEITYWLLLSSIISLASRQVGISFNIRLNVIYVRMLMLIAT